MEAMEVSRILEELADQMNRTGVLLNQHLFDAKGLLCGRAIVNDKTHGVREEQAYGKVE